MFLRKTSLAEDLPQDGRRPSDPPAIGALLRQRREALALGLDEVAAALNIKPAFLAALEEGRLDALPGRAYAIGFLRAYAAHLGLDGGELLRRFKDETAGLAATPNLSFPAPLHTRRMPGAGMVLAGLILALCGYGAWYALSGGGRAPPRRVAEVPLALLRPPAERPPSPPGPVAAPRKPAAPPAAAKPVAAPPPASGAQTAAALASPPATIPDRAAPAAPAGAAPAAAPASPPPATARPPAANPPAPPSGQNAGARPAPRIVIRAIAASWVEVRDADDAVLYSRVLKPGERYDVPDRPGLTLRTGNAGGLAITVDGKAAAKLGPAGAVRRDVTLEPQALLKGATLRQ